MVVAYNDIINAIAKAEDVALYNARARAIELSNGCKPSKEDDDKAIEIESWIQLLTRAAANYDHETCLTDDIIWDIIQNVNEQNRDVDCDVSRTYSRNASSGGGSNVPSGYVERVLGLYVDNTNPSLPVIEIFVDPLTISGDGTQADPFSAIGGGGGSQDLAQTLINGNTSGANDIEFDVTQGLLFSNTSRLREGTIDAGLGGNKGIAEICGVGFESKWEAGRRYIMGSSGTTIRQSLYNFTTIPTTNEDTTKGYAIGSLWTLDDGTTYECTDDTIGSAVWVNKGNAFIVEIAFANLAALETAGTLSLTTIYIVTDAAYRIAMKAEAANRLGVNGTIIDLTYAGSVNYDVQSNVIEGVAITDSSVSPNQWFGVLPSNWNFLGTSTRNVFFSDSTGTLGDGCRFNTFEQGSNNNTLGDNCNGNTFKQGSNNCIFGDDLLNVTIDAFFSGTDYSDPIDYAFLYNNAYASTIFTDGASNYHRYYDPANDRIVVTLMSAPFSVSYIGGGASLDLEVNGTPNGNQALLNLVAGTNITLTDDGIGSVTIDASGGGGGDVYLANDQTFTGENTFAIGSGTKEPIIITKGGNGAGLKVTKSSGSGDAIEVAQGSVSIADETALTIASFDGSKRLKSLATSTYPSLTELSYVKGVTSAIQTQLNAIEKPISSVGNGTAVTGVVVNTYSKGLLIPANSRGANDVVQVDFQVTKTGAAGNVQLRFYWNTTNDLSGSPILLGTSPNGAALWLAFSRLLSIEVANGTGNATKVAPTSITTLATGYGTATTTTSNVAIDWTANGYLICAILNSNAADSSVCNMLKLN